MSIMLDSNRILSARLAIVASVVSLVAAGPAMAQLTLLNQYTFNDGTANDSVGGADGVLMGTNGSIAGGQLLLANSANISSATPGTEGAYLDLPNYLISDAALSGNGAVTVEFWLTVQQNRNWSAAFTAGISSGGEDVSSGDNGDQSYLQFVPQTGDAGLGNDFRVTTNSFGSDEGFIDDSTPLEPNIKEHIVAVFDQTGGGPFAGDPGTVTAYRNGVLVPPVAGEGLDGAIAANLDLTSFTDAEFNGGDLNIWLGRSQWPDPLLHGRFDEFRIYSGAATQSDVTASNAAGPVAVSLPVLTVDIGSGDVSLTNPGDSGLNVTGYEIDSANGSLNPDGWMSIDQSNTFDPDGTWTASDVTTETIAESVTGGSPDGGSIAGSSSQSIGDAFSPTPFAADLTFSYTLNGGGGGAGIVEYVGTAPVRSDLNGDGVLTAADWSQFIAGAGMSFEGMLAVPAYLNGDLDGDLDNDYDDFILFKSDYIAANGAQAFALATAVPEPTTTVLAVIATLGLLSSRRK